MKIDPYKHKERYLNWKKAVEQGIPDISKTNSDFILKYLYDMEHGINISSSNSKGARSYIRLNTLREKMISFSKKFKAEFNVDDITKEEGKKLKKAWKKFLKILKTNPMMKLIAFRKVNAKESAEIDPKRCVVTSVTLPMIGKMWHLFINAIQEGRIKDCEITLRIKREYLGEAIENMMNGIKYPLFGGKCIVDRDTEDVTSIQRQQPKDL